MAEKKPIPTLFTLNKVLRCLNEVFKNRFPKNVTDNVISTNISPKQEYLDKIEIMTRCMLVENEINELSLVLSFLEDSGYIQAGKDYYADKWAITLEGRIFIEMDGYIGDFNQKNQEEQKQKISRYLTWILAVGVISPFVSYLLDVFQKYYPNQYPLVHDYLVPFGVPIFLLWLLKIVLYNTQK